MSYGLSITNSAGEVVIDDTYAPLYTLNESVLTISQINAKFTTGTLLFFKLGVGDHMLIDYLGGTYSSNQSSILTRELAFVEDLPASSGYGLEVYDAGGNRVFTDNGTLTPVTEIVDLFDPVTTTDPWMSFSTYGYVFRPNPADPSGGTNVFSFSVQRTSTGYQAGGGPFISAGGPPIPFGGQAIPLLLAPD